jgi:hypothetical protein
MDDVNFLRTLDPTIIVGGMTLGEAINTTPPEQFMGCKLFNRYISLASNFEK